MLSRGCFATLNIMK